MTRPRRSRRAAARPRVPAATLRSWLEEDRWRDDVTTRALFPRPVPARATVSAQASGVVSGLGVAGDLARVAGLRARARRRDGDAVRPGTVVLELRGDLRRILGAERTLLNLVTHLSGVASATAALRARVPRRSGRPALEVRATRKTLPGLRDLEKQAVVDGGGAPHRRDLSDAVLVKNNHLAFRALADAVAAVRARYGARAQVEVRSVGEARTAVRAGARRLLVDNAAPATVRAVVRAVRARPGGRGVEVEVSGGVGPGTVAAYARAGADAASVGALTHSAPALPFHLTARPAGGR